MHINKKSFYIELSTLTMGAGINFFGVISHKILLVLFAILIAKLLTPKDLGIFFLGFTITVTISKIILLGLGSGIIRFISIYHGQKDINRMKGTIESALMISIPNGFLVGIALYILAPIISVSLFHKPALQDVLRVFSIYIPFYILLHVFISSINGLKLMQYSVYIEKIGEIFLRVTGVIFFVYCFELGLKGVVLANLVSVVISAGLACFFAQRFIPIFNLQIKSKRDFKSLINFSWPLMFSKFFFLILNSTDVFMLGYFASLEEVAIYSIVSKIVFFQMIFRFAFQPIFSPMIADLYYKQKFDDLNNLYKSATKWILMSTFPLFLLIETYPTFFLRYFGTSFEVGAACLRILGVGYFISATFGMADALIVMTGRSIISMINNLFIFFFNVGLNYLLIPKYGINGAAPCYYFIYNLK